MKEKWGFLVVVWGWCFLVCFVVLFGMVFAFLFSKSYFPKIIFPNMAQVQKTEYCFIYEKLDVNYGYIMGKKYWCHCMW